jgi:uncharacterized protein (TIGR02271 family)
MLEEEQIRRLAGQEVYGSDGGKIGKVGQIYADDQSGRPEWLTVRTGLFGTRETFVPLAQADATGDRVVLPYTKALVKDAPNIDVDNDHISTDEERRLYSYYGRTDYDAGDDSALRGSGDRRPRVTGTGTDRGDRHGDQEPATSATTRDTSRPTAGEAMTVAEERLNVSTEKREAGRARLRKYVVTENVTRTVPVQREEVRVEREPITDANRDDALTGGDISEDEHEVVLHEERPVVEKDTVPVERVRLDTETVTEQETIDDEVRKERVDVEGDVRDRDRTRFS